MSTGRTGAAIADLLAEKGHDVTFLKAQDSVSPRAEMTTRSYVSFHDLDDLLKDELQNQNYHYGFYTWRPLVITPSIPSKSMGQKVATRDDLKIDSQKRDVDSFEA